MMTLFYIILSGRNRSLVKFSRIFLLFPGWRRDPFAMLWSTWHSPFCHEWGKYFNRDPLCKKGSQGCFEGHQCESRAFLVANSIGFCPLHADDARIRTTEHTFSRIQVQKVGQVIIFIYHVIVDACSRVSVPCCVRQPVEKWTFGVKSPWK